MSKMGTYFKISGSIAITAAAVALALAYGQKLLWIIAVGGALAALRYLILPAGEILANIIDTSAETYIKISTHKASLRELGQFTRLEPDEAGNYPAILDSRTGGLLTFIPPGNLSGAPALPAPKEIYETTVEEIDEMEELQQIEAPHMDPATVKAMSMAAEIEQGLLQPGAPACYGHRIIHDPFTGRAGLEAITSLHEATVFMCGWSTVGKSAFMSANLARRVVSTSGRCVLLIVDPHKGNPDRSLSAKIRPALDPWIYQPKGGAQVAGNNPKEIRALVDFLKAETDLRLRRDDLTPEQKMRLSSVGMLPIWLVVDEALSFARETRISGHDPVFNEFTAILQFIGTETAKSGIAGVYMTQLGAKKQLGDMEIRDVCPQQIILQTPKDQAETLGLTSADAKQAHTFPKGRGFVSLAGGGEPEIFVWGYASPEDIARAVEGLTSPLIPAWKQANNKVLELVSRKRTFDLVSDEETSRNDLRNEHRNEFPPALQAELDQIPDWPRKLATLEELIGADRRDIWQALFGKAPGGTSNAKETVIYATLLEAYRHQYRALREQAQ